MKVTATVALFVAKMKTPLSKARHALLLPGSGPGLAALSSSRFQEPGATDVAPKAPQPPAVGQLLPGPGAPRPLTHLQSPSLVLLGCRWFIFNVNTRACSGFHNGI